MGQIGQNRPLNLLKMRLGRRDYCLSVAAFFIGVVALKFLLPKASAVSLPWVLVVIYASRLHDFGRSGWWAVLAVTIQFVITMVGMIWAPDGFSYFLGESRSVIIPPDMKDLIIAGGTATVGMLIQISIAIWLGLQPSDPNHNRFGPPTERQSTAKTS